MLATSLVQLLAARTFEVQTAALHWGNTHPQKPVMALGSGNAAHSPQDNPCLSHVRIMNFLGIWQDAESSKGNH